MKPFSAQARQQSLKELNEKKMDLIIIGGGITGAGIALDAAARGMKTALFEMQDFAAGTSSRSTKLIHGGLRYLKQLEIKVVAEVGRERAIVYENGPHVTNPEWMLLPLYKNGTFGKWSTAFGLTVYDFLARVQKHERKRMLSKEETLKLEPLLNNQHLIGGGYYVEYKTDDARLTLEVMKKAVEMGAAAHNYTKITGFIYNEKKKVVGVEAIDLISKERYRFFANKIINATGPWVDELRTLDQSKRGKTLRLTKGVHLIFDRIRFPLKQATYFDTSDGRMCFAIPRGNKTYLGTTDTNYKGDIANPVMTIEDQHYLLQVANTMFPSLKLEAADIESSYAGLRPLIHQEGRAASEVSRKDEVFVSNSGLISIAGGKLTGYRKMAENVVNQALRLMKQEKVDIKAASINTKHIPLSGGEMGGSKQFDSYIQSAIKQGVANGLDAQTSEALARKYGTNFPALLTYVAEAKKAAKQFSIDMETAIMLYYALEEEMTLTAEDFIIRRSGYLLFDIEKAKLIKQAVLHIMAKRLGWSASEIKEQLELLDTRIEEATISK